MRKQKILITGSCGFIASNFIRSLIYSKAPYEIIGIDKITELSGLNNIYMNKNHTMHIGDIADEHFINVIFTFEKPDIVLHMAAYTSVDESLQNPNKFIHSNVLGTQVLVNAALKHNVKKFIYTSTDEIYGQLDINDPSWKEDSNPNPRNFYAASKLSGEYIVKAAASTYGLNYCITRASNNYGARQTPNKLIPRVIKSILEDQKIPVYGQGLEMRDWLNVADNCSAIMKVIENGKNEEIYNISVSQEFSNIEVVQIICNAMGKGHNLIEFVKNRPGNDKRYAINATKVKELGWEPQIKFKDGILGTVKWYQSNQFFIK